MTLKSRLQRLERSHKVATKNIKRQIFPHMFRTYDDFEEAVSVGTDSGAIFIDYGRDASILHCKDEDFEAA